MIQKLGHELFCVKNRIKEEVTRPLLGFSYPGGHFSVEGFEVATCVLADDASSTEPRPVDQGLREGQGVLDQAVICPLRVVSILLRLPKFLFIFFFINLSEFFNNFEATFLNLFVGVEKTCDHVGEKSRFMVHFVRKLQQHVSNGFEETVSDLGRPVDDQKSEIVDFN
jgi:hypothetical protein